MQIIFEPYEDYHARRKTHITAHEIIDFARCPQIYAAKRDGRIQQTRSAGFTIGAAAHCLILEGPEAYMSRYTIDDGPINEQTGKPFGAGTKAREDWLAGCENPENVISSEDDYIIQRMAAAVFNNDDAAELLSLGEPEVSIVGEIEGVGPVQARLDWLDEKKIVDLKTCRDLDEFRESATKYGYKMQLSFYKLLLGEVGIHYAWPFIIAVEKQEPFRCAVFAVGCEEETNVIRAAKSLAKCKRENVYPSKFSGIQTL